MIKRCNLYFAAHSADQDCSALIDMLATPLDSGELPMRLLLESARRASIRIYAVDSPFEKKDLLKARGYRWDPGGTGRLRCWYIDVPEDRCDTEHEWLEENVYGGNATPIRRKRIDAHLRYSDRIIARSLNAAESEPPPRH
jgi:DNA polymerase-3 subunit epsilon